MSMYLRTNFYEKKEINGVIENDLIKNNFDLFLIKRPTTFFKLSRSYIQRPDLLSLKLYGRMDYWWIISKINNIDDWWNDIKIGDIIRVVDARDIQDFYLNVRQSGRGI